jgi:uncharacterized LabA/DUF88 family protein
MFIDWENIKYGLLNRDNRLPNAQALKEAAGRFGRVVTAKAYANWQEGHNLRDPNDLYSVGIEPIYVPTIFIGTGDPATDGHLRRKNSVDIKLAVDAVELALANPAIETFVFATGDGDFIHLVNTLRTRGKRVVIVGLSWSTSWQLTSNADQFIPYDVEVDRGTPATAPTPPTASLDEALSALAQVVKEVRERRRPNVFAQVKLLLTTRLGSFDEQKYGFSKFKDFMREAERRGLVKTQTVGLTDRVYLPDEDIEGGLSPETPQEDEDEELDARPAATGPVDERMAGLLRLVGLLEQSSPFVSFNYIVNRALEARVVPGGTPEVSHLLDRAIREEMLTTDSRTILDRVTGEYRDINVFRLNRRHPLVERVVETDSGILVAPTR